MCRSKSNCHRSDLTRTSDHLPINHDTPPFILFGTCTTSTISLTCNYTDICVKVQILTLFCVVVESSELVSLADSKRVLMVLFEYTLLLISHRIGLSARSRVLIKPSKFSTHIYTRAQLGLTVVHTYYMIYIFTKCTLVC